MKYFIKLFILVFITITGLTVELTGQDLIFSDSSKIYKVSLKDGSIYMGKLLKRDSLKIIMSTSEIPEIEIQTSKIDRIEEIIPKLMKNGSYWFPNPHATRYLFSPSAFNLKKGEGYYQNTLLSLNSFNIGITDHISVGGALELISTFAALSDPADFGPIFFITPKVGFNVSKNFNAGGGLLYVGVPSFNSDKRSDLGIVYGIGTLGSVNNNISGGIGWGFVEGTFSGKPVMTVSGTTRISRKTALISENWIVPSGSYYGIFSYGVRFFGEKMAIDFALVNSIDIAEILVFGIPFVSFAIKF
jgi:hypothetical protein